MRSPRHSSHPPGWLADYVSFLREYPLWWIVPIALAVVATFVLAHVYGSDAPSFRYDLG